MTDDQYDDRLDRRLHDLGARWRDQVPDAPAVPGPRGRRDLTWLAAAAAVTVALGVTLWITRGLGDGQVEPAPPPTPTPTSTANPGSVAWAPLDPTNPTLDAAITAAYDAIAVTGTLDLVAGTAADGTADKLPFEVTLTSPTRVALSPCPDYEIRQQNSFDDFLTEHYALNCAAVPFKDDDGTPYLPAGRPVTFAMETFAPSFSAPLTWRLVTGGAPDVAEGRIAVKATPGTLSRATDFCARLSFDGRSYTFATEQPGSGVGNPLGNAAGTACGSSGAVTVKVYSVSEQPATEALTASYDGAVVVYVPEGVDPVPFPVALGEGDGVEPRDQDLVRRFARFALEPEPAGLTMFTDEVRIGLGQDLRPTRATDLDDPRTWTFDLDGYRGYAGPANLLDTLREQLLVASSNLWRENTPDLVVTVGDYARCAGPPGPVPPGLGGYRHVAIQPHSDMYDSCLQWFALDLYLDDTGRIAAVSLDLWEP